MNAKHPYSGYVDGVPFFDYECGCSWYDIGLGGAPKLCSKHGKPRCSQ